MRRGPGSTGPKPPVHPGPLLLVTGPGTRSQGCPAGLRPRAPPSRTSGRVAGEVRAERGCPSSLGKWPTRRPMRTRSCVPVDAPRTLRPLRASPVPHHLERHTRTVDGQSWGCVQLPKGPAPPAPPVHRAPTRPTTRPTLPTADPHRRRWPVIRQALRSTMCAASSPPRPAVECTAGRCRRVGGPLRVEPHPPPVRRSPLTSATVWTRCPSQGQGIPMAYRSKQAIRSGRISAPGPISTPWSPRNPSR